MQSRPHVSNYIAQRRFSCHVVKAVQNATFKTGAGGDSNKFIIASLKKVIRKKNADYLASTRGWMGVYVEIRLTRTVQWNTIDHSPHFWFSFLAFLIAFFFFSPLIIWLPGPYLTICDWFKLITTLFHAQLRMLSSVYHNSQDRVQGFSLISYLPNFVCSLFSPLFLPHSLSLQFNDFNLFLFIFH